MTVTSDALLCFPEDLYWQIWPQAPCSSSFHLGEKFIDSSLKWKKNQFVQEWAKEKSEIISSSCFQDS